MKSEWFTYEKGGFWVLGYNPGLISFVFDQVEKNYLVSFLKDYDINEGKEDDNFTGSNIDLERMSFVEWGMLNRGIHLLVPKKLFIELIELVKKEGEKNEES